MISLLNTPYCTLSILSNQFVPVFVDELDTPLIFFNGQVYSYTMILFKIVNNLNSPYPVITSNQLDLFRRLKLEGLIDIKECWIEKNSYFNQFHHDVFVVGDGMPVDNPEFRATLLQHCSYDTLPHLSLKDIVA